MYEVDQKYLKPNREIVWENENRRFYKGDYRQKHNKQVAQTFRDNPLFKTNNENEFVTLTNQAITEYLRITEAFL